MSILGLRPCTPLFRWFSLLGNGSESTVSTMKIVDILSEDLIIPSLESTSRDAVLRELVASLVRRHSQIDAEQAVRVLIAREDIGSTGVGNGLAIPHAKLRSLTKAVACFARSSEGVDFGARDARPSYLFLALLAPEGNAGMHLKALARASRLFKDPGFLARLRDAPSGEVWPLIRDKDGELG